jgi:hypothetical protein
MRERQQLAERPREVWRDVQQSFAPPDHHSYADEGDLHDCITSNDGKSDAGIFAQWVH